MKKLLAKIKLEVEKLKFQYFRQLEKISYKIFKEDNRYIKKLFDKDPAYGVFIIVYNIYAFLILLFSYIAWEMGWFTKLSKLDISKLSFVILALFIVGFISFGLSLFFNIKSEIGYLKKYEEEDDGSNSSRAMRISGLFFSEDKAMSLSSLFKTIAKGIAEWTSSLGMLGTVIGFIVMTINFTTISLDNVENIKELFKIATTGMSTALFTTAIGLVTSLLLQVLEKLLGEVV